MHTNVQQVPRFIVLVRDITQRRTSELDLRANHALINMAGRVARIGGWLLKLPAQHVQWSDEVCLIHEVPVGTQPTLEEAIDFYAPEYRERIQTLASRCIQNGEPYDEELEILTSRGKRVWVRTMGEALRNKDGIITQIQGAFQDISDLKHAEEANRDTIATALDLSVEGVKTLVRRAKATLRDCIQRRLGS
jgi:PAS domain-containing protein